jgi:hypothetical protein
MATIKFSLWDFLGAIPDPRAASGRRYALRSILGVIIAGTLAGRNSIRSIARWAKSLREEELKLLGISRKTAPSQTAMHELLVRLNEKAVEEAFSAWAKTFIDENVLLQIAIDGKTLKGSGTDEYPALHLLAAYCSEISSVIMQKTVVQNANEITAAKEMLFEIPLKGKFISGDAIFCQKEICNIILKNHGDYIFIVKGNQKQLLDDIKEVFKRHSFPLYIQPKRDGRIRKY